MPRNGAGVYERPTNWTEDRDNGIPIEAVRHDDQDDDYAAALTQSISRDGQSPPTTNLPMGGFKFTNLAKATATGEALVTSVGITGGDVGKVVTVQADGSLALAFPAGLLTKVVQSGTDNIPNNSFTSITWNSAPINQGNRWTSGPNITVEAPGLYRINGALGFNSATAGFYAAQIANTGGAVVTFQENMPTLSGSGRLLRFNTIISLSTYLTFSLKAFQNTGATVVTTADASFLEVERVG